MEKLCEDLVKVRDGLGEELKKEKNVGWPSRGSYLWDALVHVNDAIDVLDEALKR